VNRESRGPLWPFALLVLLVLVPAGFVLWFMNEAIATQSAIAQRSVLEAHRGQLRLVRSRVDAHWRAHATALSADGPPAERFAQIVREQTADGAVLLNADGSVAFPDEADTFTPRARALAADIARLDALAGPARETAVDRMAELLNDYTIAMAGSERLALMDRLRSRAPNVGLPTEAALRLSLALAGQWSAAPVATGLQARLDRAEAAHFQQTAIRGVWAFASGDGRTIALYWTGRIEALMHDLLHQVTPAGVRFIAFPPDVDADPEAISAGAALPGWQLTFQPLDRTVFEDAGRRRAALYVAVGGAGLAAIALVGVAVVGSFRRHLRLARLKTDLVASVSHELRTPLASMRVLVDGLLADEVLDERKTRDYLGLLSTENARLTRVVENFLTFSRLERGRQQFTFAAALPATIVAAAVDAIRDRMPADCHLRVDSDPDLPAIVVDSDALVTALVNLLDNALKYTAGDKRIHVRVRRDGDGVIFAVGDNGIGIPAREQRRIFRRFYRVDQRLTRDTGGVGLGLSIVDLIVRAHGGSVGVVSEAGCGSTFTLRLPAARAAGATT
jgi:signal transduction histidine kinase